MKVPINLGRDTEVDVDLTLSLRQVVGLDDTTFASTIAAMELLHARAAAEQRARQQEVEARVKQQLGRIQEQRRANEAYEQEKRERGEADPPWAT